MFGHIVGIISPVIILRYVWSVTEYLKYCGGDDGLVKKIFPKIIYSCVCVKNRVINRIIKNAYGLTVLTNTSILEYGCFYRES